MPKSNIRTRGVAASALDSKKEPYIDLLSDNYGMQNVIQERPEDLSRQSLGRPLTDAEVTLAEALTAIFGTGQHDLAKVSEELEKRGVARPSGEAGAWSLAVLEHEITAINASLDAAHEAGGITRLA